MVAHITKLQSISFSNQKGFSLIELMVVLVIVAFAAAGIRQVVNPNGSIEKQINTQGDQLFAQMQFALDEALFTLNPLGLVIDEDSETGLMGREYAWYSHNGDKWVQREKPLAGGKLEDTFAWQVVIEDEPLEESLDDLLENDEEEIEPHIAFYPSGEVTPFDIEIGLSDTALLELPDASGLRYKIAINERGALVRFVAGEEEI